MTGHEPHQWNTPLFRRCCVFVDGESLRFAAAKALLEHEWQDVLRRCDWAKVFSRIVGAVSSTEKINLELIRVYWYAPRDLFLVHHEELQARMESTGIDQYENDAKSRFSRNDALLATVCERTTCLEVRRSGSLIWSLSKMKPLREKGVDVSMAVDLIELSSIYDYAVIVSGDQDYVPAIDAVKNKGKKVACVEWLAKGEPVPGQARALKRAADLPTRVGIDLIGDSIKPA